MWTGKADVARLPQDGRCTFSLLSQGSHSTPTKSPPAQSSSQLLCLRVGGTHLHEGVLLRGTAAGLLHELAVDLTLQLGVHQADLQGRLRQGHVVVHGGSFHGHVDEELAGLGRGTAVGRSRPHPLAAALIQQDGTLTGERTVSLGLKVTADNPLCEHRHCWQHLCLQKESSLLSVFPLHKQDRSMLT